MSHRLHEGKRRNKIVIHFGRIVFFFFLFIVEHFSFLCVQLSECVALANLSFLQGKNK